MAKPAAFELRQLFDRTSCTYTYLLMCLASREAVLIDPVLELVARDLEAVEGMGAKLKYVLNTHVHADHVTGSGKLKAAVPGLLSVISEASGGVADVRVAHQDKVEFGNLTLVVRSTPGHTPGCVTYVLNAESGAMAFTGDALMIRGCGRTDFQGGCPATLYDSVHSQILSLPDDTKIWSAHDYSGRTVSTVGEEKKYNPRLTKSKEEFVALMHARFDGSKYPGAIDASLPANMVCGVFEADGVPVAHPDGFTWKPRDPPTLPPALPSDVAAHLTAADVRVLDLRGLSEVAKTPCVEGAYNLPSNPTNAAAHIAGWAASGVCDKKDTPIVLYCGSGRRAGLAGARLVELGYSRCLNGKDLATINEARAK